MIQVRDQRHRALVVASVCAAGYLALTLLAVFRSDAMDDLDRAFGREPQDLTEDNSWAAAMWRWIGDVSGPHQMTILTVIVAIVLLVTKHPRAAALTFVTMASTEYLTRGFKLLVERQRPVWNDPVEIAGGYSFPSGHSSGIAAAAGIAIVLSTMFVQNTRARRAIAVVAVGVALLIGADRIFLGVHNISDVIAGFLLGTAVLLIALVVLSRWDPPQRAPGVVQA